MKTYTVVITATAMEDIKNIYYYIRTTLNAPIAAQKQYKHITESIQSLSTFPERIKPISSANSYGLLLRRIISNNYSIFFVIHDSQVEIIRVLYSASDISHKL